jgi:RIO-like serine/threonine protein kinase
MRKTDCYEIADKIGRGKYAQVFSAIESKSGQKVALKILKPGILMSQQTKVQTRGCHSRLAQGY